MRRRWFRAVEALDTWLHQHADSRRGAAAWWWRPVCDHYDRLLLGDD